MPLRNFIFRHGPVLLGVALIVVTVVVLLPITGRMYASIEELKTDLIARIEEASGQPVSYSRIAPSILQYVQISDLRLGPPGPEPVLEVQRLRVYYDIIAIMRGRLAEAITEIRVENSSITIDPSRQKELFDLVRGLAQGRTTDQVGAAGSLQVSGRNVSLRVTGNGRTLTADRCFFDFNLTPEAYTVSFRGRVLYTDEALGRLEYASSSVQLRGDLSPALEWATVQLSLGDARTALFGLGRQEFQVDVTEDSVDLRRINASEPVDIQIAVDRETWDITGQVLAEDFDPSTLGELYGPLESIESGLPTSVSGSAQFSLRGIGESPAYTVRMSAEILHPAVDTAVAVAGEISGDESRAILSDMAVSTAYGSARYDGDIMLDSLLPAGTLRIENARVGSMDPLNADFELRREEGNLYIISEPLSYAGVRVSRLLGFLRPERDVSPFAFELVLETDQEIAVRGTYQGGESSRVQATVSATGVDAGSVAAIYEGATDIPLLPPDLVARYQPMVDADAIVWTNFRDYLLELTDVRVTSRANPSDSVALSAVLSPDRLVLEDLSVEFLGYSGAGRAVATRSNGGGISFDTDFTVEGISYDLSGRYRAGNALTLSGRYGVDARFYTRPGGATQFRVTTGRIPLLAVPGRDPILVSFDLDGLYRRLDEWEVILRGLDLQQLPLPRDNAGVASMAGTFGPTGGSLKSVSFSDSLSSVAGEGIVAYEIGGASGVGAQLVFTAPDGGETYGLSVSYDRGRIDGFLRYSESPVARLGFQALRGNLSGEAEVTGTLWDLEAVMRVALSEGRFNSDAVSGTMEVTFGSDELVADDVQIRYLTTQIQEGAARIDLSSGFLEAEARYVQLEDNKDVDVGVDLSAQFGGEGLRVPDVLTRAFSARLTLTNLPGQNGEVGRWMLQFDRDEEGIRVEGGPENSIRGRLSESGEFELQTASPFPISFSADGRIAGGRIETNLNRLRTNLEEFPGLTDLGVIRFLTGAATGSLRIVGPVNDPDFYGTLVVTDTSASIDLLPDIVIAAKGYLVFQEKVMRLVPLQASSGPSSAQVEGEFLWDRWNIEEYRVGVRADSRPGMHIVYDFNAVDVDGFVFGDLTIFGTPSSNRFEGTLTAQSTAITLSEEIVDPPDDGELYETIADLTIVTGKGIEFFWPTNTFPILRAFAETGEAIELYYTSADGSLSLRGDVGIQGGELFYFDRNFYIRSGSIVFQETEVDFDPRLTVTAEIRDVSTEGPVRIYLSVDNSPLSEFSPRFSSDPPLSEVEILSVLGGNILANDGSESLNLQQAVILTSDLVTQFGVVRSLEGSVRRALGLDLFTVRTHLFPNLIRGAIGEAGYPLDNASPSLGKYLDNTTIFLGKYLGTDLFLELLMQLRAENPLETNVRDLGGLSVDWEFSLEWKTPFFLLEWNFFPRTPEDLFLTDNTFVFSWEYSF